MSTLELYGFVALGVTVSIVLPLIRALVPRPKVAAADWRGALWGKCRPYVITAVFSLIVAALLMAFLPPDTIDTWRTALLAGYGFDSTLQKFSTGNSGTE
jgi:hypothetical protein